MNEKVAQEVVDRANWTILCWAITFGFAVLAGVMLTLVSAGLVSAEGSASAGLVAVFFMIISATSFLAGLQLRLSAWQVRALSRNN